MDTNKKLGNNLRYYRRQKDLTLKEMAEKLEMSFGTYQKYETGNIKHVDIDIVTKFSKVLDVPVPVLMGWADDIMINVGGQNVIIEKKQDHTQKALELYQLYENADPRIKAAVESLLKGPQ